MKPSNRSKIERTPGCRLPGRRGSATRLALAGALVALPLAAIAQQAPKALTTEDLESDSVRWNELTLGKSKFRLYGFLRLDAIYDDSRPNNTQIPAYIRSEDPAAPAAIASAPNSEDLTIHPRLSRFGLDFFGPEIAPLGGATARPPAGPRCRRGRPTLSRSGKSKRLNWASGATAPGSARTPQSARAWRPSLTVRRSAWISPFRSTGMSSG